MEFSYQSNFEGREDLKQYERGASLALYALELRFGVEDIETVATDSITDGSDDKKCDLIYIDTDKNLAVVIQAYYSSDSRKDKAPSNKASDLNTAAGWLLNSDLDKVPERIKSSAIELRQGLEDEKIKDVQFWYVHNLPESENVEQELSVVRSTVYSSIVSKYKEGNVNVTTLEVGTSKLENWYLSLTTPIQVTDSFEVETLGGYEISGSHWTAFMTAIHAFWLHDIFNKYKDTEKDILFSANVRGYLGSRSADANINNGIKSTVSQDPGDFWAYNNGLTILTNKMSYEEKTKKLKIEGMSIVNGAQTTGAIGSIKKIPDEQAKVPVRFIKCDNDKVIKNIIQYNNSQNKIEAPDFRSRDPIQTRLRKEFEEIPSVTYSGGRRGGMEDRIERPSNLLPSDGAAKALAIFHGDPVIAYNKKSEIWVSDSLYSTYFSETTSAKHIVFCYSLLRAVGLKKKELQDKKKKGVALTDKQEEILLFFQKRASTSILTSAIAACIETILLDKRVPNKFMLFFKGSVSPEKAISLWSKIVEPSSAFTDKLMPAIEQSFNNKEKVESCIKEFKSLMEATKSYNKDIYAEFAEKVSY